MTGADGAPRSSRAGRAAARSPGRGEHAQATVELALVLPVLVLLLLAGIDVAVIARDAVHVEHAARQAARVAAVNGDAGAARAAALDALGPSSSLATVDVGLAAAGGTVSAHVRLVISSHLALIGRLRPGLSVEATVHLRREGDPDEPP